MQIDVAQALLCAVFERFGTLVLKKLTGVHMSVNAARTSACATL